MDMVVCPACNGDSRTKGIPCFLCDGTGTVEREIAKMFLEELEEQKRRKR